MRFASFASSDQSDSVMLLVVEGLRALGIDATYEYPGVICIPHADGVTVWATSNQHDPWTIDRQTLDGGEVLAVVTTDLAADCDDVACIVETIRRVIETPIPAAQAVINAVWVVITMQDGRITDTEILDTCPRWNWPRLGQIVRMGNVNGGDSVEVAYTGDPDAEA